METSFRRRGFLSAATAGVSLLSRSNLIAGLEPVARDEVAYQSGIVPLRPEIEPLVRLIEDTPRERLMEEIGAGIRKRSEEHTSELQSPC